MDIVVTSPPASPLVPLDHVKQHLRIDEDDGSQDVVLATLVDAAVATIDGPEGWLGRALGRQSLELRAEAFPCAACTGSLLYSRAAEEILLFAGRSTTGACDAVVLPCPPIVSVSSVVYRDADGVLQTLDPSAYQLFGRLLLPVEGTTWPVVRNGPGAVTIAFTAGYESGALPARVTAAVLLMTATLYENREGGPADLTGGTVGALLDNMRIYV